MVTIGSCRCCCLLLDEPVAECELYVLVVDHTTVHVGIKSGHLYNLVLINMKLL